MKRKSFWLRAVGLLLILSTLTACATPTPEVIEKVVTQVVEKVVTQVVKETVKETVIVEGTPQIVEKEVTKIVEREVEVVVTPTPEPKEEVVLRWGTLAGAAVNIQQAEAIGEAFHEKYPWITVQVEGIPGGPEWMPKLATMVASGTLPDILYNNSSVVGPMARQGITLDLNPLLEGDPDMDLSAFWPAVLDWGTVEGEIHMIGRSADVSCLYYNKTLFDAAGVNYPTNDWTWDDFYAAATALTTDDTWGFTAPYNWSGWWLGPLYAEGGALINEDGTHAPMDTLEAIRGLHYAWDGINDGIFIPLSEQGNYGGWLGTFGAGKAAMSIGARWFIPAVRDALLEIGHDFDVAFMPKGSVRRAASAGTFGLSISSATEHLEETWMLMKFMFSKEGQKIVLEGYGVMPPVKDLAYGAWRDLPGPPYNNNVYVDMLPDGVSMPHHLAYTEAGIGEIAAQTAIEKIERGGDFETAVKEMVEEIDAVLAEYQ